MSAAQFSSADDHLSGVSVVADVFIVAVGRDVELGTIGAPEEAEISS